MRLRSIFFLLFILGAFVSNAQGVLKGKVTDEKGEPVFGVIAVAVEDQSILAQTDFEGKFQLKFPKVAMPLRVLITGIAQSPSIDQVMALIGREEVLARIGEFK